MRALAEHAARVVARDRARAWQRIESGIPHTLPVTDGGGLRRVVGITALVAVAAGAIMPGVASSINIVFSKVNSIMILAASS